MLNAGGSKFVEGRPTDLLNAGYSHCKEYQNDDSDVAHPRRSYNNTFVAAYPDSGLTKTIAYLPPKSFQGPTDGNLYERIGPEDTVADEDDVPGIRVTDADPPEFATLEDYNDRHDPWERHGIQANPPFRSFDRVSGQPDPDHDDLRPRRKTASQPGSPASSTAVAMPDDSPRPAAHASPVCGASRNSSVGSTSSWTSCKAGVGLTSRHAGARFTRSPQGQPGTTTRVRRCPESVRQESVRVIRRLRGDLLLLGVGDGGDRCSDRAACADCSRRSEYRRRAAYLAGVQQGPRAH